MSRTDALTADYVIVGAGSAGAALAARLSEDPATTVLLLEAGGPDKALELHVPAAFSKLFRGPFDWNYDTVPQAALGGRTIFWPRGKTLGGSSSLNAMMWVRGFAADYDEWADDRRRGLVVELAGSLFPRVERTEDPADPTQGADGPQSVEHLRDPRPHTSRIPRRRRAEAGPARVTACRTFPTDRGSRRRWSRSTAGRGHRPRTRTCGPLASGAISVS